MKVLVFGNPTYALKLLDFASRTTNLEVVGLCCKIEDDPIIKRAYRFVAQLTYDLKLRGPSSHMLAQSHNADQDIIKYISIHKIPLFNPQKQKRDAFYEHIKMLKADIIISFGYPRLIPPRILNATRLGGINIHPGTLPTRGGGTPMRWAVYHGDKKAGLYAHAMTSKFDAGGVLKHIDIDIGDSWDAEDIEHALLNQTDQMLISLFHLIENAKARFDMVSDTAPIIEPPFRGAHQQINWEEDDSEIIIKKSKAMHPKSGALAKFKGQTICFYDVEHVEENISTSQKSAGYYVGLHNKHPLFKTQNGHIVVKNIIYGNKIRSGSLLPWYFGLKVGDILD